MKSKKIFSIFLIILILIGSNKLLGITLKPKEKDGLWGYVDENNFWRINPQYHFAAEFHNGCARVMNYYNHNGYLIPLYNYVKSNGDKLFEKGLDYASDFQNGYAVIGSRWGGEFKPSGNANYTLPDYRMHLVDSMGVEYNSMYANVLLPPDSLGIV